MSQCNRDWIMGRPWVQRAQPQPRRSLAGCQQWVTVPTETRARRPGYWRWHPGCRWVVAPLQSIMMVTVQVRLPPLAPGDETLREPAVYCWSRSRPAGAQAAGSNRIQGLGLSPPSCVTRHRLTGRLELLRFHADMGAAHFCCEGRSADSSVGAA